MIDACASAGLCGLPVERILAGDEIERAAWLRIAQRAADLRVQLMKAEASHIAYALAKTMR